MDVLLKCRKFTVCRKPVPARDGRIVDAKTIVTLLRWNLLGRPGT